MAVAARRPAKGTIHDSDHGGQFIGVTLRRAGDDDLAREAGSTHCLLPAVVNSNYDNNSLTLRNRRRSRAIEPTHLSKLRGCEHAALGRPGTWFPYAQHNARAAALARFATAG